MRPWADTKERGFTLVELLVSLTILGMIGLLVVVGLNGARRVWERADVRRQEEETTGAAETVLRHRVEDIAPSARHEGSFVTFDFTGEPASLEFVAPPSDAMGIGAVRRYVLLLRPDGNLVLTSVNDLGGKSRYDEVLLHGVQSLDLAYFSGSAKERTKGWRNSWVKQSEPPTLVRIRVRFPPGDISWLPEIVIHPKVSVDSECQLVNSGRGCGRS